MLSIKNKTIVFLGKANSIDLEELETFILQNKGCVNLDINDASLIVKGKNLSFYELELFKNKVNLGIEALLIEDLEKLYFENVDIDSIVMSLKLTKSKQRLIKLLKCDKFSNEQFLKLLKIYDFEGKDLYFNLENKEICTKIVERFCFKAKEDKNIQYAPIGIYYTALETNSKDLLEVIYKMPEYNVGFENINEKKVFSLKEAVVLNPNTPKEIKKDFLRKKVFKRNEFENIIYSLNEEEIFYLSQNNTLDEKMIEMIYKLAIPNATINILRNSNVPKDIISLCLDENDKFYNIAIAHNESLDENFYYYLYELDDYDVKLTLAQNKSTPKEILDKIGM